jgi:HK97 family phage portal protein
VARSVGIRDPKPPRDWSIGWWQEGRDIPRHNSACAAVEACVAAHVHTVAQLWPDHWRYTDDGGRKRITDSNLARILRRPNSYETRTDFMARLVRSLLLDGNVYALAIRDGQAINEMHIMDPRVSYPVVDPETRDLFYVLAGNPAVDDMNRAFMVPARDVMHIRINNLRNTLKGESPIYAAAAAVAANQAISNAQATFFTNMSRPSGVLTTDQKLTGPQVAELRDRWNDMSAGLNTGRVPILTAGLTWAPMSISNQDAQLVDAFKMTVVDIARAFSVPLPLVNSAEGSSYANTEQLMSFWLSSSLGFYLDLIETAFDQTFRLGMDDHMELDPDSLLRVNFKERIEAFGDAVTKGLFSPNEARRRLGYGAVENGDEPRVQQQMVPLSFGVNQPGPVPAPAVVPALPAPADPAPADPAPPEPRGFDESNVVMFLKQKRARNVA